MIVEQVTSEESHMDDGSAGGIYDSGSTGRFTRAIEKLWRRYRRSSPRGEQESAEDLIYQGKPVDLRKIPIAREMYLKKKDTVLGKRFKRTLLGYTKGAVNQFRGPFSTHVREYSDHYTIHRDFIDPRKNPISHLAKDAPMELAAWIIGALFALVIIVLIVF